MKVVGWMIYPSVLSVVYDILCQYISTASISTAFVCEPAKLYNNHLVVEAREGRMELELFSPYFKGAWGSFITLSTISIIESNYLSLNWPFCEQLSYQDYVHCLLGGILL